MIGSRFVRALTSLVASALAVVALAPAARADRTPAAPPEAGPPRVIDPSPVVRPAPQEPEEVLDQKLAVWRFDALGIDPELVARLETLFRMELDRLDKQAMPSASNRHTASF